MSSTTDTASANAARNAAMRGLTPKPLTPAQMLGADPLPESQIAPPPSLYIKLTYDQLAEAVAKLIPGTGLYRKDGTYGTIRTDAAAGLVEFLPMEPDRFTTWLAAANVCTFHSLGKTPPATEKNPNPLPPLLPTSLSPAQAKIILASDALRDATPEIAEIYTLRLPVMKKTADGKTFFAPAPIGYDAESKIYTLDSLPIDWNPAKAWPLERCVRALCRVFADFPLDGGTCHPIQSRSLGAIVTAMLGQFLHHCVDLFPMVCVNANQPGTGKSFCVQAMLAPFYGEISAGNHLEDDNEFRKTLNAAIFEGVPFYFLDDLKTLAGRVLPRYTTIKTVQDRILGTNKMFTKPNRMQFFITGNALKTSPDIERRTLPIDLFTAEDATKRTEKLDNLKEEHFSLPAWRKDILSALWGITLHWVRQGCPRVARNALPSFKRYTSICANIAMTAGFADPFGPRLVNLDTGDTMGKTLIELVTFVADGILPPMDDPSRPHTGLCAVYKVAELVDIAREQNMLDIITNAARDPAPVLGKLMRSLNGRQFTDSHGRKFQIGNATRSVRTAYPFAILSEPTRTPEDTMLHSQPTAEELEADAAALAEFGYTPGRLD